MRFLRIFPPLCLFIAFLALHACSPKVYTQLTEQVNPVAVDAEFKEYETMRFYSRDLKMAYTLANDNKNLYFCGRIDDEAMQQKIMNNGLVMWIDTTPKPTYQIGITYPVPGQRNFRYEETKTPGGLEETSDFIRTRQTFFLRHNTVRLTGFKPHLTGVFPLENKGGIRVKMNWDSTGSLIYEAAIPFKSFYRETLVPKDSLHVFCLSFVVNNFQLPNAAQGQSKGSLLDGISVGVGTGIGTMGGIGMGGNYNLGGGPRNAGSQNDKTAISTQFRLAVKAD